MEIAIMKILHHPGVINLIDIFRSKGSLVLILEYIKGGNLKQYLENWHSITERKTKHIVH